MQFRGRKKSKQADAKQVFDYACWLLARRVYSQAELLKKFNTRFIPDTEIFAAVLKKLEKLGLQSDEDFTESFVRSHPGWGSYRLKLELSKRGISEEMIELFLPQDQAELSRCQEALQKKLKDSKVPEEYAERQKLAAFLARRGFSLEVIKEVLK